MIEEDTLGSRKQTAHEIAARVKAVPGWTVTAPRGSTGHYTIKAPDGWRVQIHMSPSDTNFDRSIMRDLNAHGFEADEAKWKEKREREKAAELEAARRDAERKAAEIVKRTVRVNKAAGPYAGPEEVGRDWFMAEHPAPIVKLMLLTPELATWLMDECNTDNRPLRRKTVEHYKAVILSGQWHLTHQGMALDVRKILQDGQHRLQAIREAGVTVPVFFFAGMPQENFKAIDEGLLRRAADLLAKDSDGYAASTAAVVKLVDAWDSIDPRRVYHSKQTNESIYDLFQLDAPDIRESVRWGVANYRRPKMNATGLAAAHYLIRKANGKDNPYVAAFFHGLVTGLKGDTRIVLDDDDPRTKLRQQMENARERGKRTNALDNLALTVMAWNFVVENHRPKYMAIKDNMELPKISQCGPTGPWKSAIPDCLRMEIGHAEERSIDRDLRERIAA